MAFRFPPFPGLNHQNEGRGRNAAPAGRRFAEARAFSTKAHLSRRPSNEKAMECGACPRLYMRSHADYPPLTGHRSPQIGHPAGDFFADRKASGRGGRRGVQHMDRAFRIHDVKIIYQRAVGAQRLGAHPRFRRE